MGNLLRSFRLGIINLLGVTVPGLIVLFLIGFGCLAPVVLFLQDITTSVAANNKNAILEIPPIGAVPPTLAIITLLILAYIIGYIFRLSTPDVLDRISAECVMDRMGGIHKAKEDHWPYRGKEAIHEEDKIKEGCGNIFSNSLFRDYRRFRKDKMKRQKKFPYLCLLDYLNYRKHKRERGNKFPYFHFKDYLYHRNHKELSDHIKWNKKRRSKTFVNKMKLETHMRSPQLSAIIESNEAHIRLLFGIWRAARLCLPFVLIGIGVAFIGIYRCTIVTSGAPKSQQLLFPYSVWLVLTLVLAAGSAFSIWRIQNLFHYRRVRELFDIVVCFHLARQFSVNDFPPEDDEGV